MQLTLPMPFKCQAVQVDHRSSVITGLRVLEDLVWRCGEMSDPLTNELAHCRVCLASDMAVVHEHVRLRSQRLGLRQLDTESLCPAMDGRFMGRVGRVAGHGWRERGAGRAGKEFLFDVHLVHVVLSFCLGHCCVFENESHLFGDVWLPSLT